MVIFKYSLYKLFSLLKLLNYVPKNFRNMDLSATVAIKKLLKHSIQATQSSVVKITFEPGTPPKRPKLDSCTQLEITLKQIYIPILKPFKKPFFTMRFWLDGKLGKRGRIK